MTSRKLVVISSGLSQPSSTRLLADRLAAATVEELKLLGIAAEVRTVEVRDHAHDIVNNVLTGFPSGQWRTEVEAIGAADGVIAVTPVLKASYAGIFKTLLDVLDEGALAGKPVAIAASGGTARHSLILEHAVRPVFAYLRAVVVPTAVFAAAEDWSGGASADSLRERIGRAAAELAEQIAQREPAKPADPFALTASFEDLLPKD
ncbi:FMN reductase [Hamadaea tsunoensis]|uniref:FMN reductase n=1 Tax=Hamadaea tsunoensis TaxID=53368 RepID=UPI00040DF042|nr:FMN reductase [Hamadaea tsunoensis]